MSYGTNAPTGLIPQSSITGATWNNQTRAYEINASYATVLSKGDPVMRANDGTIRLWASGNPVLGIFQGCFYLTNSPNVGTAVSADYWPGVAGVATGGNGAGNSPQALVVDDPNVVFTVQTSQSGSAGGVANPIVAYGAALNNFGCNISVANTINGNPFAPVQPSTSASQTYTPPNNPGVGTSANLFQSGMYADLNTMSNTATVEFKIIGFDKSVNPGQVLYVAGPPTYGVFNNVLLLINNHIYKGGTGTVGTGTVKTAA